MFIQLITYLLCIYSYILFFFNITSFVTSLNARTDKEKNTLLLAQYTLLLAQNTLLFKYFLVSHTHSPTNSSKFHNSTFYLQTEP